MQLMGEVLLAQERSTRLMPAMAEALLDQGLDGEPSLSGMAIMIFSDSS